MEPAIVVVSIEGYAKCAYIPVHKFPPSLLPLLPTFPKIHTRPLPDRDISGLFYSPVDTYSQWSDLILLVEQLLINHDSIPSVSANCRVLREAEVMGWTFTVNGTEYSQARHPDGPLFLRYWSELPTTPVRIVAELALD